MMEGCRVNELKLSLGLYFMDGFISGLRQAWAMRKVGIGLLRTGRLNLFGLVGQKGCRGAGELQRMLAKARLLEDQRKGLGD